MNNTQSQEMMSAINELTKEFLSKVEELKQQLAPSTNTLPFPEECTESEPVRPTRTRYNDGSMLQNRVLNYLSSRYGVSIDGKTLRRVARFLNMDVNYDTKCHQWRLSAEEVKTITELFDVFASMKF